MLYVKHVTFLIVDIKFERFDIRSFLQPLHVALKSIPNMLVSWKNIKSTTMISEQQK